MLADFTINIHEARKPLAVRVKIHDNIPALRMAATKCDRQYRKKPEDHSETLGICHRFHMMNDPLCAIVRLAPPHIGAGMVAHEMGHAAIWLWEIQNKFRRTPPLTCANDEWFCWILGELVRRTTCQLHDKGVY
jgi:hypothetical protein